MRRHIDERIPVAMTEAGECEGPHKTLRGRFMDTEKSQVSAYICDLEHSLALNKQIIAELFASDSSKDATGAKKVILKLNSENAALQSQLKKVIKERDECQAKMLINNQIVDDCRKREAETARESQEKLAEIVDQLNRKEFFMQNLERKYDRAVALMKRFSHKDQEIRQAFKELAAESKDDRKIANVVEENELLQTQLSEERKRTADLARKLEEATKCKEELETIVKSCNAANKYSHTAVHEPTVSAGPKLASTQALEYENAQLQKKVEDLYKLNVKLSETLQLADEKLRALKRQRPESRDARNKSALGCFRRESSHFREPEDKKGSTGSARMKDSSKEERMRRVEMEPRAALCDEAVVMVGEEGGESELRVSFREELSSIIEKGGNESFNGGNREEQEAAEPNIN